MPPRILVTAADSLVGRELVRDLHARNIALRAGIHDPEKAASLARSGIEIVPLDYDDLGSILGALRGIDSVYLQTPLSIQQPEYARRFVHEAGKSGIRHIVYLSLAGVRSEPGIQVWQGHRQAEECIESCGIGYTFLRPNAFMQNFIRCWQPVGGTIHLPLEGGRVSYVDARDVAAVALRVLTTGEWFHGKAYSLTGPLAPSLDEIAESLSAVLGMAVRYEDISEIAARTAMEARRMQGWMIQALLELYSVYRVNLVASLSPSVEHLIGRKPRTFRDFVHDYRGSFERLLQREYHVRTVGPYAAGNPRA